MFNVELIWLFGRQILLESCMAWHGYVWSPIRKANHLKNSLKIIFYYQNWNHFIIFEIELNEMKKWMNEWISLPKILHVISMFNSLIHSFIHSKRLKNHSNAFKLNAEFTSRYSARYGMVRDGEPSQKYRLIKISNCLNVITYFEYFHSFIESRDANSNTQPVASLQQKLIHFHTIRTPCMRQRLTSPYLTSILIVDSRDDD